MSPTQTLPSKKDVALALLERSSVYVHLDPRQQADVVPPWFKKQPELVLRNRPEHAGSHSGSASGRRSNPLHAQLQSYAVLLRRALVEHLRDGRGGRPRNGVARRRARRGGTPSAGAFEADACAARAQGRRSRSEAEALESRPGCVRRRSVPRPDRTAHRASQRPFCSTAILPPANLRVVPTR